MKACGQNKKVTHHSHLKEEVTANRKRKEREGGKTRGRIVQATLQVHFSSEFMRQINTARVTFRELRVHRELPDKDTGANRSVCGSAGGIRREIIQKQ